MQRFPRTATNIIAALTALAWVIAAVARPAGAGAAGAGLHPARLSGVAVPWPAVPAFLTPLTATLVHSGLIHLGFNLLVFLWCGTPGRAGARQDRADRPLSDRRLCRGAGAMGARPDGSVPMIGASGAISAVIGAFALSFGRASR